MHSAEELAELARTDKEVVEESSETVVRPTNRKWETREDEFQPIDKEIPSLDSTFYELSEE
jgi:hypothetical protein